MKENSSHSINLIEKIYQLDKQESVFCLLNSNGYTNQYSKFQWVLGYGTNSKIELKKEHSAFDKLIEYQNSNPSKFLLGFFSYDLKNDVENLNSNNKASIQFPSLFFFDPKNLLFSTTDSFPKPEKNESSLSLRNNNFNLKSVIKKEDYLEKVNKLKSNILEGDIYEITFCMEFILEDFGLDPIDLYFRLNQLSPMPYSAIFKNGNQYIISASPERFLKKSNNKLISQPIKGTIKRNENLNEDELQKEKLLNDPKERAENVMIVDLVRNDLKKSSQTGSVKVTELFGIYSFPKLHQMISTIESELSPQINPILALKYAFPMGSMTGAPKVRAMQLIDEMEVSKRSAFSGALGYIDSNGDFDFSVIIRSIFIDTLSRTLSFQVGSAITLDSDPEKEYIECLLKAEAILESLK